MRVLVTAGPTREYLDPVRFLTNGSSGRMGLAVAAAARDAGAEVTLLTGPVAGTLPDGCRIVRVTSVDDLRAALDKYFDACDALVMAAAVGDFRPERHSPSKLPRAGGPVTVRLVPTEDLLAGVCARKRADQTVVAFAVEDPPEAAAAEHAAAELKRKGADYVVVNTPDAMDAETSRACICAPDGDVLPWAERTKTDLAGEIVKLLERRK
ncbi:MAG: phosphopantothenoylcysteine decarboxylase [Phycisphaerae bacterium]|nr:phosphopantothenoylcysteine decarboxylase [Phycisphaerae bacterium]